MGGKQLFGAAVVLVLVILVGWAALSSRGVKMDGAPAAVPQEEGAAGVVGAGGIYEPYAPEKLVLAEQGKVVLFFRASWCPTCRGVDADIRANLGKIPEGVAILDINYDTATELKQKYGITYQHTFVQVDAKGYQITKWTGSQTLAALLAQVK
jgi:thiol-disulfide isomerase/thioredoxin